MHIRRSMAADQIGAARKLLSGWERRLRKPPDIVTGRDGMGKPTSTEPIPEDAMVLQTLGEEDTIKLRAELAAIASTLEGLAGT